MATSVSPLIKDFALPIVIAILPFIPGIYATATTPDHHFVYEVENERNPVEEWNRQLERMFKQLDPIERKNAEVLAAPLLKRIGSEIYKSLPALLAGAGVRPMDISTVKVLNVSDQQLKNIRVHFVGCTGFDSYVTWPDSLGSSNNPRRETTKSTDQVTLRYDKLPPSANRTESQAILRFYGTTTSDCKPVVEVDTSEGKPAFGKKVILQDYRNESQWDTYHREQRADLAFKTFLSLGLLYVYFQNRLLRKKLSSIKQ